MSSRITIDEAQATLKDLVRKLAPGEEVVILDDQEPVAKIVRHRPPGRQRPPPGLGKGIITYIAPDFDETPEDFKDYRAKATYLAWISHADSKSPPPSS